MVLSAAAPVLADRVGQFLGDGVVDQSVLVVLPSLDRRTPGVSLSAALLPITPVVILVPASRSTLSMALTSSVVAVMVGMATSGPNDLPALTDEGIAGGTVSTPVPEPS